MQDNERKPWQKGGSAAKAIGAYVANMLDPIARARGFAITSLLSEWPAVVGEELARFTAPEKVVWPRRSEDGEAASPQSAWRTDGAILVLKVDGPRAIEVQHRAEEPLPAHGIADTGLAKALGRLAAGIRGKTPGP